MSQMLFSIMTQSVTTISTLTTFWEVEFLTTKNYHFLFDVSKFQYISTFLYQCLLRLKTTGLRHRLKQGWIQDFRLGGAYALQACTWIHACETNANLMIVNGYVISFSSIPTNSNTLSHQMLISVINYVKKSHKISRTM